MQWVYPGQSVTVVGRLDRGADVADLRLELSQGEQQRTVRVTADTMLESDLASRLYGQVAVGQLESLGQTVFDVAAAYARHFRITGQTCSLLMLESEADYERFGIVPQEDLFVIKSKNANELVESTIESKSQSLADPKAQFLAWLARLENMPGMEFRMPTALKLVLDDIEFDALFDQLECQANNIDDLTKKYIDQLSAETLDYNAVMKEAQRRGETSSADAVKVLSSLIEQNTGDLVLARDVAFSAMEMSHPAQAYHLLTSHRECPALRCQYLHGTREVPNADEPGGYGGRVLRNCIGKQVPEPCCRLSQDCWHRVRILIARNRVGPS